MTMTSFRLRPTYAERSASGSNSENVRPLPRFAHRLDPAAVSPHHVFDDRESQTGTFALARKPIVRAVELLEDPFVLTGQRNARDRCR